MLLVVAITAIITFALATLFFLEVCKNGALNAKTNLLKMTLEILLKVKDEELKAEYMPVLISEIKRYDAVLSNLWIKDPNLTPILDQDA
jgi:hypothetical protein